MIEPVTLIFIFVMQGIDMTTSVLPSRYEANIKTMYSGWGH